MGLVRDGRPGAVAVLWHGQPLLTASPAANAAVLVHHVCIQHKTSFVQPVEQWQIAAPRLLARAGDGLTMQATLRYTSSSIMPAQACYDTSQMRGAQRASKQAGPLMGTMPIPYAVACIDAHPFCDGRGLDFKSYGSKEIGFTPRQLHPPSPSCPGPARHPRGASCWADPT